MRRWRRRHDHLDRLPVSSRDGSADRIHRPAGAAPAPGRADRRRHRPGPGPRYLHHGPGGRPARDAARRVLRRPARRLVRERHRRARPGADGQGRRPGRRRPRARPSPSPRPPRSSRWLGATPVFVDVAAARFNLDPASLEAAASPRRCALGLRPCGVIARRPVRPARRLRRDRADLRRRTGLWVLADAAQGFGAAIATAGARHHRHRHRHQLLPGQAARLLRRRRRDLHRRRRRWPPALRSSARPRPGRATSTTTCASA